MFNSSRTVWWKCADCQQPEATPWVCGQTQFNDTTIWIYSVWNLHKQLFWSYVFTQPNACGQLQGSSAGSQRADMCVLTNQWTNMIQHWFYVSRSHIEQKFCNMIHHWFWLSGSQLLKITLALCHWKSNLSIVPEWKPCSPSHTVNSSLKWRCWNGSECLSNIRPKTNFRRSDITIHRVECHVRSVLTGLPKPQHLYPLLYL